VTGIAAGTVATGSAVRVVEPGGWGAAGEDAALTGIDRLVSQAQGSSGRARRRWCCAISISRGGPGLRAANTGHWLGLD
jgi:hypothetical protein